MNSANVNRSQSLTITDIQQFLLRGRAFIALILVLIVFTSLSPQFLSPENIVLRSKHVAINALLASGLTFIILNI